MPVRNPKSVREPMLRIMLPTGFPLTKGENIMSAYITYEADALYILVSPNTKPRTVACMGPRRHPARRTGMYAVVTVISGR